MGLYIDVSSFKNKEDLENYLASLAVVIQHSNGENAVDKGTIEYDEKGNKAEIKVSCGSDNVIKVSPVNPYKSGETYYIYISKKVTSKYKEPLTEDLRYEFTVK